MDFITPQNGAGIAPAKRIVIIGATSGIGKEAALLFARKGWRVGAAGRRKDLLRQLEEAVPHAFVTQVLDVTTPDAPDRLSHLIRKLGGMDVFLLCAGIGTQNPSLQPEPELRTATTNVEGFIRMTSAAFNYFKTQGGGHLAAITSIAGTKGLGIAPAYSATKRFQNTYLDALAQLARMQRLPIRFTDIRPGFVDTDLLKGRHYPMTMSADRVARHLVKAIERKKRVATIDLRYRLLVFFWRMIPRWLWERLPVK